MPETIRIGCAGWSLRKEQFHLFPEGDSHLQRYAARFDCVEINSSFYRPHRVSTYQRWADATPADFRFAVKLPKQITHVNRLKDSQQLLAQFAAEVAGLGPKLGAILVQLPPSYAFEQGVAAEFFQRLTQTLEVPVAVEPRHASWFAEEVALWLAAARVGRVAADPALTPAASLPLIAEKLAYYRWHGSPRTYYSAYSEAAIAELARQLVSTATTGNRVWCIFDNTAEGAAAMNALSMQKRCAQATTREGLDVTPSTI